jgi:hypothetical protein
MEDDLNYFQMKDEYNNNNAKIKTMVVAPLRVT